jgi:hypothetical protein
MLFRVATTVAVGAQRAVHFWEIARAIRGACRGAQPLCVSSLPGNGGGRVLTEADVMMVRQNAAEGFGASPDSSLPWLESRNEDIPVFRGHDGAWPSDKRPPGFPPSLSIGARRAASPLCISFHPPRVGVWGLNSPVCPIPPDSQFSVQMTDKHVRHGLSFMMGDCQSPACIHALRPDSRQARYPGGAEKGGICGH